MYTYAILLHEASSYEGMLQIPVGVIGIDIIGAKKGISKVEGGGGISTGERVKFCSKMPGMILVYDHG